VKTPNLRAIRQVIRERVLAVDGVTSIPSLDAVYNPRLRTLAVSFTAATKFGTVSQAAVLG
jgi:hypothetical protein